MAKKILSVFLAIMLFCTASVFAFSPENYKGIMQTLGALDYGSDYPMDALVTRAQFTKMAIMISPYRDSVATNMSLAPFRDVTHKYWGAPYIHIAVTNGIVNGYKDGSFRPDDNVVFEDGITIALRILGYNNDDFGSSWPYGQIGIANKLDITQNINSSVGKHLTRGEAITILYNTLLATPKGQNSKYIDILGYQIYEDTSVISSSATDSSLGANRVYTTAGTFKTNSYFEPSVVGMNGTVITKDDEFILFFTDDNTSSSKENYTIYTATSNDVLVYKDGVISSLGLPMDTTSYLNGQKTTLKNIAQSVDIGYGLTVCRTADDTVDYVTISSNSLSGPFVASSSVLGEYKNTSNIIKNGMKSFFTDLNPNDILYYSKSLDTLWAYSKKITGIYESALPNKDTPTSVTISGKQYNLEGAQAFSALSSAGTFNFGDTVTLLLGKNGDVAGVISPSGNSENRENVGYLIATGTKQYTDENKNEYTSFYATVVNSDGTEYDYATVSDYKSILNSVVKVSFSGEKATLSKLSKQTSLSGIVSYQNMKIGTTPMANDIKILDVSTTLASEKPLYCRIFPQRIDSVDLKTGKILYYTKNSVGEITSLILYDVTGDMYKYGIVTKAETSQGRRSAAYSYTVDGNSSQYTSSTIYSVSTGAPAKFNISNNQVSSMISLIPISSAVSSVSATELRAGGNTYIMSDKVVVFEKTVSQTHNYHEVPLYDYLENYKSYSAKAYIDKEIKNGGRVRVIVIEKN